jgi:predicted phosphodiesterase
MIEQWPATQQCDLPDLGRILFCHATPRNDTEVFTRLTAEQRLIPVFANVSASVVVCGHTHMQFDRTVAGRRIVNAGSVGMPYQSSPGAYWLLLGGDVQLRRTDYDFAAAGAAILATGYPQVEALVVRYVINPPAEEESLQLLAGAELS